MGRDERDARRRRDEIRWRDERAALNSGRARLGRIASGLYPGAPRVAGTALLCRPEWIPPEPIPLESMRLEWDPRPAPPAVADPSDGLPEGHRTYAGAMAALAPPATFEDRPSYRLLDAAPPVLRFGPGRYFDGVNVGEAVAHELAAREAAEARGLPLRERVGDPCDLSRRTALNAITTLTVTTSGSYVLHWRDPAKVAHAGGLYQVMPVGVFQPLGDERRDLDLWRCMVREYAEELLGGDEDYGEGFVQDDWTFHRVLTEAREKGAARARFLGLGVDPLSFALDLLTVVVVEDAAFGDLFGGLVAVNDEGEVAMAPFDGTVPEPMQPAGAAALELAWRHRRTLGITPPQGAPRRGP
ncbi:transcriptional regulator [Actinomadura rubrisoli]|uniref:Transcriptional regulator n=1 Tax=Actinomadura rubrisoli TaxID=2530368 RepID=A0A4V2YWY6_9ACTN|nr:transcriptional regulator [Actinomadura rubrisoli]TDD87227.1 transcriptional regulator [Actinomadura rubrisoli]